MVDPITGHSHVISSCLMVMKAAIFFPLSTSTILYCHQQGHFLWPKKLNNMTLYDQTKMTELEHTTTAQRSENSHRDGSPMFSWNQKKSCVFFWFWRKAESNAGCHVCPDFHGLCPDLQYSNLLGVHLHPHLLHHWSKTYSLAWSKLKTCMDIDLWAARTCIFRQWIIFHPNNFKVHLHLCQHSQCAQVC